MIITIPDDLPLDRLDLDKVVTYLLLTGWKRGTSRSEHILVFIHDVPEEYDVIELSTNSRSRDMKTYLAIALMRLAEIEGKTPQEVAERILLAGQDVIDFRLLLKSRENPSLRTTSCLFQGLQSLVTYGACMEKDHRRRFERPLGVGREQTQHFQFARTFQGSFGFTIASPIPQLSASQPLPVQRKVLERITRGFLFTKQAELRRDPEEISRNFETGFNANMCKAVVDMLHEMQDTEVFYSVTWSHHLAPSPDVAQVTPILLQRETSRYLQEAAQYLEQTAEKDLEEDRTVEGFVINLSSEEPDGGTVTLSTDEWEKVNFSAETEQYVAACKAHLAHQMVSVRGKLTKQGNRKYWLLQHPYDFHLLT